MATDAASMSGRCLRGRQLSAREKQERFNRVAQTAEPATDGWSLMRQKTYGLGFQSDRYWDPQQEGEVSYWEWFKLIGLSVLISMMMTATAFAIWWHFK
jgi:hypothetical protein